MRATVPCYPRRRPLPEGSFGVWRHRFLALLWCVLAGAAAQAAAAAAPGVAVPTPGLIWSATEARILTEPELHDRIALADLVLLGEVHDNSEAHRWQARILERHLQGSDRVGFEQLDAAGAAVLNGTDALTLLKQDRLGDALRWSDSGWPAWPLYRPVFAAVVRSGASVQGLALPRDEARQVMSGGFGAVFSDAELAATGVEDRFSVDEQASMARYIRAAHCDALPETMVAPMVHAQIARDAAMAVRVRHEAGGRSFVIVGNGHARKDWGMPQFLARLHPEEELLSIQIVEIIDSGEGLAAYPQTRSDQADVVIFVPAQARPDPCEGLRAMQREAGPPSD